MSFEFEKFEFQFESVVREFEKREPSLNITLKPRTQTYLSTWEGNRTPTRLPPADFESAASTNSATQAFLIVLNWAAKIDNI